MPLQSHAAAEVSWKTYQLQGYFNSEETGKGIGDTLLDYIIDQLPEYEHNVGRMPIARTNATMGTIHQKAFLTPVKTKLPPERLSLVHSSTIQLVIPPPGIVVRKEDLNTLFSGGKDVSIRTLLNGKDRIIFCWHRGATYHPAIRRAAEDYMKQPRTPNIYVLSNFQHVYEMLNERRIDAFISHSHPFYVIYDQLKAKMDLTEMVFIPVTESAGESIPCYTFASGNLLGKELIAKVDAIHQSDDYKSFIKKLIREHYRPEQVDEYIEKNMQLIGTPLQ